MYDVKAWEEYTDTVMWKADQDKRVLEVRQRWAEGERERKQKTQGHHTLLVKTMTLTEFCPQSVCFPAQCPPSDTLQRRKTNQRPPVHPHPSHPAPTSRCVAASSSQKWDALQCCTLRRRLPAAHYRRRQELLHHPALSRGKSPQRWPVLRENVSKE